MKHDTCFVQLGRFGDLLNILPCVKAEADERGTAMHVLTHKDYAPLLDGVSYAEALPMAGDIGALSKAVDWAWMNFGRVIVPQMFGDTAPIPQCSSWALDEWRRCGRLEQWDDLPLVFDRRDRTRESELKRNIPDEGDEVIIVTCGVSSPFKRRLEMVEAVSAKVNTTWLDGFRAERLYDFLGVFERSAALVTIDTWALHLSYATKTPTYALLSDVSPWHRSHPRKHWIGHAPYNEADFDAIAEAVSAAIAHKPLAV